MRNVVGISSGSAERQDRIMSDSSPYSVFKLPVTVHVKLWIFSSAALSSGSFREETNSEGGSL